MPLLGATGPQIQYDWPNPRPRPRPPPQQGIQSYASVLLTLANQGVQASASQRVADESRTPTSVAWSRRNAWRRWVAQGHLSNNLRPLLEPPPVVPPAPTRLASYLFSVFWNPGAPSSYDQMNVARCEIRRGRRGETLNVEQGRCVLEVYDPDGVYNPANASSPIAANLKLMRRGTVQMTPSGASVQTLFTGFVARIWHDPRVGVKTTTIELVDGFEFLNIVRPTIAAGSTTTVGESVQLVLTAAGVAPGLMDLDRGDVLPGFQADGSKTGLQLIDELIAVDRGLFFVAADGFHTYRDRSSLYGVRTPVTTFTNVTTGEALVATLDILNVINAQTVTAEPSGAPQFYQDPVSNADYGTRQPAAISSAYLRDDTQALSLATHVVLTRKSPDLPTRTVSFHGMTVAQVQQQALREMGEPVTLSGLGPATAARIEGVRHWITRETHRTEYTLALRTSTGFTVGVSVVQGTDVFVY